MALSVAALESLKAAVAACASVQAVACFGAEEAAAGLRMANELRAIFLPLSRVQNKTGTASGLPGSLPPRRLRGGAKRVAVSSAAGRAPAHASRAGDHPSLAFGTPNSAFRRPPLRLAMSAGAPIRSVSLRAWITFSPSKTSVPRTPTGVAHKEFDSPPAASGRVVRLVQARASTAQRAETGSDLVVTPARRSTRGESKFSPSHQSGRNASGRTHTLLRETNYAYAPNDALLDSAKKGRSISA